MPLPQKAQRAWNQAAVIDGFNPDLERRDTWNRHIRYGEYEMQTGYGWTLDKHGNAVHILSRRTR